MSRRKSFQSPMAKISESEFESHAMRLFHRQAQENAVYRSYLQALGVNPLDVEQTSDIPFLPIEFFKTHEVKTGNWPSETIFESSGTSSSVKSFHHVEKEQSYREHARAIFEDVFSPLSGTAVLALLPSYLERTGSSLINMVEYFIEQSENDASGFYLYNQEALIQQLKLLKGSANVVLFGVTFALLELAKNYQLDLSHVTLIETGGMKGRGKELTRDELYQQISEKIQFKSIYSEYGMTELFSQAYGVEGKFMVPASMRVQIRDINDPFATVPVGSSGGINIIDLANEHSCAFIETKDIGRLQTDGSFEVLGRIDNSELRGCNLLLA